jgi:prolyl 4-hydroxylase
MKRGGVVEPDPAVRLASLSGIQKVPTRELQLYICREFTSADDCAALCELIGEHRPPSTIAEVQGTSNFRTSETCDPANC